MIWVAAKDKVMSVGTIHPQLMEEIGAEL